MLSEAGKYKQVEVRDGNSDVSSSVRSEDLESVDETLTVEPIAAYWPPITLRAKRRCRTPLEAACTSGGGTVAEQ